jgi:hypothetical protein
MSEHSKRPILSGFMVLDGWAEDYSDWDGQITGPDNPRGANLHWLDPIPMIETRALDDLRRVLLRQTKALEAYLLMIHNKEKKGEVAVELYLANHDACKLLGLPLKTGLKQ